MSKELEAFLEYLTVVKILDKKSIEAYKSDLVFMEEALKKPLIEFESEDILNILSFYKKAATKNRKIAALNSFFKFCQKSEFLDDAPNIEYAKKDANFPKYLTFEEISTALKNIKLTSWIEKRDYAFILFLYASGARVSEALEVKKDDIEDGWVKFLSAKRDKQRVVPLANSAIVAIQKYLEDLPFESEYIWLNYKGKKLSRISAFKIVKKYLNTHPHTLRHSFATALVIGGADLRVVQEFLGHSSLNSTSIYTHVENAKLKESLFLHHPLANEELG